MFHRDPRSRRFRRLATSVLTGIALTGGTLAGLVLPTAGDAQTAALQAGAGRAEIVLTAAMLPLQEFGSVHDALQARVLVLHSGPHQAAIAVIDMTSIFDDEIAAMKAIVGKATGVAPGDILICASHTFSAPHIFAPPNLPPDIAGSPAALAKAAAYRQAVEAAVGEAARAAQDGLRPARLAFGEGASAVNVSRNLPTADGYWLGANAAEPVDHDLGVLRIEDADHQPIALLVNYAVQSSIMDHSVMADGTWVVSADLAGEAMRRLENAYGGKSVALFLIGAAGDQIPLYTARTTMLDRAGHPATVDRAENALPLIGLEGGQVASDALRASEASQPQAAPPQPALPLSVTNAGVTLPQKVKGPRGQLPKPTRVAAYTADGQGQAPYTILRLNDVAVVGVQVELSAQTAAHIRRQSPFAHTMVVTMVNGAAKYLPTRDQFAKVTYEAVSSGFMPGAAETMADRILDELATLHRAQR